MPDNAPSRRQFAERLREESLAVSLTRKQFGVSRKVNPDQKEQIATLFGADAHRLSAGKKLVNKRHEKYLAVSSLLNQARETWQNSTLPYPEPGLRLIRRERVQDFDARMRAIRDSLQAAVTELEAIYREELIPDARERLGDLFNASDYPAEISGEFEIEWGFSNVDPPEYLRQISPRLFEQEQERVRARFEEAIAQAEAAFTDEFAKAVEHLVERLTPAADGKQKIFKESAVENIREFFDRFRSLDIGSNAELSRLIDEAQQAIAGVNTAGLRKDVLARDAIRNTMAGLATKLDALTVDRPKRKITLDDADFGQPQAQAEQPELAGLDAAEQPAEQAEAVPA